MNRVFIFTLPTCAPCNELKRQLDESEEFKNCGIGAVLEMDMTKPNDFTLELGQKYNVRSCPTVVVLRPDGTVYYNGTQCRTAQKLVQLIQESNNG